MSPARKRWEEEEDKPMGHLVVRDSTLRSHYESVERVIAAMRTQLDQPMSLRSMARIACASPYHFNRTFRQVTGVPPSQFLYAMRLDTARRLLMHTQKKVIDICYDVGYNSVGTFTRRFTDLFGISPTTLRELSQSRTRDLNGYSDLVSSRNGKARPAPTVSGYVSVPGDFHGLIFVGLFETPIPQAKPLACSITSGGGLYQIEDAPEGESYLFALGLRYPIRAAACLDHQSALRGGGHPIQVSHSSVSGPTYLSLRPPSPFDPPILLVLSSLMDQFFSHKQAIPASTTTFPSMVAHHG